MKIIKKKRYYTIGQFSKISNIPIKQLRYLDNKKILSPSIREIHNNYRYYSYEQLDKVILIKNLRNLGFSFNEVFKIMEDGNLENFIEDLRKNIGRKKTELDRALQAYEDNITFYKSVTEVYMKCAGKKAEESFEIITMPQAKIIGIRSHYNSNVNELFIDRMAQLQNLAKDNNISVNKELCAFLHSGYMRQFTESYGDLETFFTVKDTNIVSSDHIRTFPSFKSIKGLHKGSYCDLEDFYKKMECWAQKNNIPLTGKSLEVYRLGPDMVPNEEDYVTIIFLEIKE